MAKKKLNKKEMQDAASRMVKKKNGKCPDCKKPMNKCECSDSDYE